MEPDISTAQEMEFDPNSVLSSIDSNETSNPNSKRIRYNLENKAKMDKVIKAKAAEFYHQYYVLRNQSNVEFKSSNGWFTIFAKERIWY
ncbi:unnamed protein product [Brachionus calyciflorus]|uniref:Uncharacterized protein n=1 Tax=Brachionus calyciflorus TaxID=104777 RepID=A0A814EHE6_9BILA|nr:unnamed protein product [Brachionus calyciflorus]